MAVEEEPEGMSPGSVESVTRLEGSQLGPRGLIVAVFVSLLVAFLCALFLGAEEAQAKGGGNGGPGGGNGGGHGGAGKQAEGAPGGAGEQAGSALGDATKQAGGALDGATKQANGDHEQPGGGGGGNGGSGGAADKPPGGALDGAVKQTEGALGGAAEQANGGGHEQPGGGGGGNTAPTTSIPRVDDKAASLDAGPVRQAVTEQTQQPATSTLKEPGGGTLGAVTEPVETASEAAAPTLGQANETLGKATEPLGETSEPLVEGVAPTVEAASRPVLEKANSTAGPVLGEATRTVEPVSGTVTPLVEQVGQATSPLVKQVGETAGPALKTAAPIREAVDPALHGTTPLVEPVVGKAAPILGAAPPAVEQGLGREAAPVLGRVPLQEATPSSTEPYLGARTPVVGAALGAKGTSPRAALGPAAPAFEPLFGTGYNALKGAELTALAADMETPGSPSATIPSSSVLDARSPPDAAREAVEASVPHRSVAVGDSRPLATRMAAAPSEESHPSRSSDGPLDGRYPAALGSALAKIAQNNQAPSPLGPSGFPYAAPTAGGSFGGLGVGLELLGALALLSLLWRAGNTSRSPPESFGLASIPTPVIELPG